MKKAGASDQRSFSPSTRVIFSRDSSSSDTLLRQPLFTPTILPIGVSVPIPNGRTPQCLQQ
jgi:hypothetical protein